MGLSRKADYSRQRLQQPPNPGREDMTCVRAEKGRVEGAMRGMRRESDAGHAGPKKPRWDPNLSPWSFWHEVN
jgi:hypothetical protein